MNKVDEVKAVEVLEFDEVHHGVAASTSESAMRFLADRNIQLNIYPSSNVILNAVESFKKWEILHPNAFESEIYGRKLVLAIQEAVFCLILLE